MLAPFIPLVFPLGEKKDSFEEAITLQVEGLWMTDTDFGLWKFSIVFKVTLICLLINSIRFLGEYSY